MLKPKCKACCTCTAPDGIRFVHRMVLKATNKKLSVQEVELIREAMDETDVGSR